jgi:hypothetical protein
LDLDPLELQQITFPFHYRLGGWVYVNRPWRESKAGTYPYVGVTYRTLQPIALLVIWYRLNGVARDTFTPFVMRLPAS